ncbi:MAG: hypothetical protein N2380_00425 [bacterium]|nr:hypothetical protein [bacterium]
MRYSEIIKTLPEPLKIPDARSKIRQNNESSKIIVLDDDSTGCQTVHDISILLDWKGPIFRETLFSEDIFYILTNSRAYSERKAMAINRDIAKRLKASFNPNKLKIISRSDSTLRGHFYGEVKTLMDILGPFDGVIVAPYFKEGKRFTVADTHYVLENDELIEVNKTEFSRDPVFGYKNAYLPHWIEEKSKGLWKSEDAISISIVDTRKGGPERIKEILLGIQKGKPVIVNALCDEDLEVFILGLIEAEKNGKRFLYRTAASFVKVRAGIEDKELISPPKRQRGLIIVGSFVNMTTIQLERLLKGGKVNGIEIKISNILNSYRQYLKEIVEELDNKLKKSSVAVYTEREYFKIASESELKVGEKISNFLSDIVKNIKGFPEFIISKGGITSHVIAERGLSAKKVKVLGQIAPGVPLWELGKESKYPGLMYVVFPGNVGDRDTLLEVYKKFTQ